MSSQASAFDRIAPLYGEMWSNTFVGQLQREQFQQHMLPLFREGQSVLDMGCGTGDDAAELSRMGIRVTGIDSSAEMVCIARSRGVDARHVPIEKVGQLGERFDGVISNFGAMNCVERLTDLREPLAAMLRPGGWMALCFLNRVCLWETAWYLVRHDFKRATRRWRGRSQGLGISVFYPTAADVEASFRPDFVPERRVGIGLFVPPSYVTGISEGHLRRLAGADRAIAAAPGFRSLGDHQLLLFRRK